MHVTTKQVLRFAIHNGLAKIAQDIAKIMKTIKKTSPQDIKFVEMIC